MSRDTFCMSQGTFCMSWDTYCISQDTSCLSQDTSCMSQDTSGMSRGDTSCMSQDTSCMSRDTLTLQTRKRDCRMVRHQKRGAFSAAFSTTKLFFKCSQLAVGPWRKKFWKKFLGVFILVE